MGNKQERYTLAGGRNVATVPTFNAAVQLWSNFVCSTVARAFSERYVILHVNGLTCLRSGRPSDESYRDAQAN